MADIVVDHGLMSQSNTKKMCCDQQIIYEEDKHFTHAISHPPAQNIDGSYIALVMQAMC